MFNSTAPHYQKNCQDNVSSSQITGSAA